MFSFPTRVFNCYAAEWLFYYYSSWSWQVNYALAFCPLFRPLFLTGCGYINYALASVHRMHALGNWCNYVLDLCALGLL